ncbi:hypothetical protein N752_24155 [Desulforamulus aquiferis]|nr:hypothetical protein N752_24155 [Desulforamulus aquiferis]
MVKIRMWQRPPSRSEPPKPANLLKKPAMLGKTSGDQDKAQPGEELSKKAAEEILGELNQLVGLNSVKN